MAKIKITADDGSGGGEFELRYNKETGEGLRAAWLRAFELYEDYLTDAVLVESQLDEEQLLEAMND